MRGKKLFIDLAYSLGAVFFALLLGGVLIHLSGYDVREAYLSFFDGAFGNVYNLASTLMMTIPLIFTGLAVAVGFQAGLFNVGGEGQLYLGALASALAALFVRGLPPALHVALALAAGALAGGLWALVPGYLKARTGAHEVITTIMFNYVGILLAAFLVKEYFKEPGRADQTPMIPASARIPELIPDSRLTWALFLGILAILAVDYLLKNTSLGYEIQAVGQNLPAAEYAGIDARARMTVSMLLSGMIAGLAGSTMVLGVLHRFINNFSPGYGYTGIAVAVLARNKPWGILPAALLFGALQSGGMSMQLFARIPMDLMTLVQGLVILLVAAPALMEIFVASRRRQKGVTPDGRDLDGHLQRQ